MSYVRTVRPEYMRCAYRPPQPGSTCVLRWQIVATAVGRVTRSHGAQPAQADRPPSCADGDGRGGGSTPVRFGRSGARALHMRAGADRQNLPVNAVRITTSGYNYRPAVHRILQSKSNMNTPYPTRAVSLEAPAEVRGPGRCIAGVRCRDLHLDERGKLKQADGPGFRGLDQ